MLLNIFLKFTGVCQIVHTSVIHIGITIGLHMQNKIEPVHQDVASVTLVTCSYPVQSFAGVILMFYKKIFPLVTDILTSMIHV